VNHAGAPQSLRQSRIDSRPKDPKIAWEPEWSVKIRVKSMSTTIVGMEGMEGMDEMPSFDEEPPGTGEPPPESDRGTKKRKRFNPFDAAKQTRP